MKHNISKVNFTMDSKPLLINELKDAFLLQKLTKSSGVNNVSFNIINKKMVCEPLIYIFQLSLEKGVFPDDLKITNITPIYKARDIVMVIK